jgi:hypothetical protein
MVLIMHGPVSIGGAPVLAVQDLQRAAIVARSAVARYIRMIARVDCRQFVVSCLFALQTNKGTMLVPISKIHQYKCYLLHMFSLIVESLK